jgi:hypothetical protein
MITVPTDERGFALYENLPYSKFLIGADPNRRYTNIVKCITIAKGFTQN